MRRSCALTILALSTLWIAAGPAAAEVLRLDPAASSVTFTLDATAHTVHGAFRLQGGEIVFSPATGEASGRVVIEAASGSTGNAKRDRKMHQAVLESVQFKEIVFVVRHLSGTFRPSGDSQIELAGTLAIHGAAHEVAIPARVHVEGDHLTAAAQITIPYVAWGLADPSFFLFRVAKEVRVILELKGTVRGDSRLSGTGG